MERLLIEGGHRLEGTVQICGAKNAALPLIASSLLSSAPLTLTNLPDVADIRSMLTLMEHYGVAIGHRTAHAVTLDAGPARNIEAPYDIVRRMRATILVLGPLLARFGHARVSMPGGCAIGARPVDLHIKALATLGATISLDAGTIDASAPNGLTGARIVFGSLLRRRDGDDDDGGDISQGRDRDHERVARARGRRPRALPRGDGREDRGRGHASHPRPGRRDLLRRPPRGDPGSHRGRHLRHRGRHHGRASGADRRAAGASFGRRRRRWKRRACRSGRRIAG